MAATAQLRLQETPDLGDGRLQKLLAPPYLAPVWGLTGRGDQSLRVITGHRAWVRSVVFSPDWRLLALGGDDRVVRLWDFMTGVTRRSLDGHFGRVTVVVFSPDGRLLATASRDETVRLWEVAKGVQCHQIASGNPLTALAWSGNHLAIVASNDLGVVRIVLEAP